MCCGFGTVADIIAGMMHNAEKVISCAAVASVIACFVFTTLCMIALGIGIGYNYCIGEMKAGEKMMYKWQQRSLSVPKSSLQGGNVTDIINETPSVDQLQLPPEMGRQNATASLRDYLKNLFNFRQTTSGTSAAPAIKLMPAATDFTDTEQRLKEFYNMATTYPPTASKN